MLKIKDISSLTSGKEATRRDYLEEITPRDRSEENKYQNESDDEHGDNSSTDLLHINSTIRSSRRMFRRSSALGACMYH